jgi:hypothetical protein
MARRLSSYAGSRRRLSGTQLFVLCLAVGLLGAFLFWLVASRPSDRESTIALRAVDLRRQTIYESPQDPGYTSWTGAWIMPDRSLMVGFVQATGPVEPGSRQRIPRSFLRALRLDEPLDPRRDFWGLETSVKYLRSADGGVTWKAVRTDRFRAQGPHGYTPQATLALGDGTLIRRVNGWDQRYDDSVPHTAYIQRLPRGARDWSEPRALVDPARYTFQFSRLRRLRDGRLIAIGVLWEAPAGSSPAQLERARTSAAIMTSRNGGQTWSSAFRSSALHGEWDAAELPKGDLLAVFRTRDPHNRRVQFRQQALLERRGSGWALTDLRRAPLEHSGHPELLATREGPILHIASTGAHYTSDAGETWHRLSFAGGDRYESEYYPRSLQTAAGTVYVFSHVGGDDYYGERDQSIVMDRFRLVATRLSVPD